MKRARSARSSRKTARGKDRRRKVHKPPTLVGKRETYQFNWRSLLPILVVVAGFAAYVNSFSGPFLFDDEKHIAGNLRLRSVWPLGETMGGRRPLLDLTLAINYAIGRLNVRGYHVFNLTVHILAGLTLFGVIRRTLLGDRFRDRIGAASPWLALVAALIWVVHPLQTQSVTYLIQRGESLMGLFYLLTLYCVIRGVDSPNARWWYAAGVASCALGMGSKAVMLTAPLVVLLYDRTFITGSFAEALRRRWGLYVGLAATWGVLIVCGVVRSVMNFSGRGATVGFAYKGITPAEYLATQFGVIDHYLRLSLWPQPLCLDYDWPVARSIGDVAWPALVVVPLLMATVWALVRKSWSGFAGAWFFLILAPTSSIVPIKDPAFEHRMYLPLAAVVLVVVIAGYTGLNLLSVHMSQRASWRRSIATAVVVVFVGLSTYGTVRRNRDYHTVLGMWRDVLAKRPTNARAYLGLGTAVFNEGEVAQAKKEVAEARRAFAEAEQAFTKAVRFQPNYADAYYNLGNALAKRGKPDEAIEAYRTSLRIKPRHDKCHYNLGNTLKKLGRLDEAVTEYRETLRINPRHVSAHINLGNALKIQGLIDEAIKEYHNALRIKPHHANGHYNLGDALRRQGKLNKAIAEFRLALQYDRNHRAARASLDALLGQRTSSGAD